MTLPALRKYIVASCSVALVSISCITFAAAADELTIALDTSPQHLQTKTVVHFAEMLEKRSNGELKTRIYDSAQLYNSRDLGKAVARGDAGMGILTTPSLSRIVPDLNIFDLPMLDGLTMAERNALVDGPLGDRLSKEVSEKLGVTVPGHWFVLGRILYWSTKKPIASYNDFKGLQVRIPGGAVNSARLDALGATPVVMPFSDTPLALQQGTVDATMASTETVTNQKLTDTGISHAYWDQGIVGYQIPIVSTKYWTSLTADQQALFSELWNEAVESERAGVEQAEAENRAALEKKGVVFAEATNEDVKAVQEKLGPVQPALIAKLGINEDIIKLAEGAIK